MYLCADEPLEGAPSTVMDLSQGEPRIVRRGTIDPETAIGAATADGDDERA